MKGLIVLLWEYVSFDWKRFLLGLLLPIIVAFGACVFFERIDLDAVEAFYSNILTILGILLGFSISFHAIFLSGDSVEFKMAKNYYGEDPKKPTPLSLFRFEVAHNIYVIIVQSILILLNVFAPFAWSDYQEKVWLLSVNFAGVVYVILLLLRSVIDSYLIVTTKK